MRSISKPKNRTARIIIWTARVLGSVAGTFWALSLIVGTIQEIGTPITTEVMIESIILTGLIAVILAGVIVAWWIEKTGGIIIIVAAAALCIFAYIDAGFNKIFAMLTSGFPFLISGILFLIGWWVSKKAGTVR
jgi:hypothetical protein